jgi:hypothetical protein
VPSAAICDGELNPVANVCGLHWEVAQLAPSHECPHSPQFWLSSDNELSQPSATTPLQFPNPMLQTKPHAWPWQTDALWGHAGHVAGSQVGFASDSRASPDVVVASFLAADGCEQATTAHRIETTMMLFK